MQVDVDAAIARSARIWHRAATHVDCEGAFLDRALLAAEVVQLRRLLATAQDALNDTEDALAESEREIEYLTSRENHPS